LCLSLVLAGAGLAQGSGVLFYSGTNFTERWQNDGGIVLTRTVTLSSSDDNFGGTNNEEFVASGKVIPSNVPAGLTASATRTATNKVVIAFSGTAPANTSADNINNLSFAFQNAAFSNGPASSITWASGTNLTVSFLAVNPSNFWVSTVGNDSTGNGTTTNPYATVAKALTFVRANANDVIRLKPGLYTENSITKGDFAFTVAGDTRDNTILQAAPVPNANINKRIFSLQPAVTSARGVAIRNLTLRYGSSSTSGGCVAYTGDGRWAGDLTLENCRFQQNSATNGSDGGAVNWTGNASSGPGKISINNCEFLGNSSAGAGGAVMITGSTPVYSNSVFRNNTAYGAGGGAVCAGSTFLVYGCLFVSNIAFAGSGGAVLFPHCQGTFDSSTFAFNSAATNGGATKCDNNGAIVHKYINCTVYSNSAQYGGGVYHASGNTGRKVDFYNTTVFGNVASVSGGGLYGVNGYNLYSTIFAGNSCPSGGGQDIRYSGTGQFGTNSIVGNNELVTTDFPAGSPNSKSNYVGTVASPLDARVLPLADNGGQVLTCALQADSVAIDHGLNALGAAADGRGAPYTRESGAQADIGAFESGNDVLPSFAYSSTLFAGTAAGIIYTTNTITLSTTGSDTFSGIDGQDFVTAGWLQCANVPAGLTVTATRASSTVLNVAMIGQAASPTNVFNLAFTLTSYGLVTSAAVSNSFAYVSNQSVSNIAAVFTIGDGSPGLSYNSLVFREAATNNGTVTNTILITLSNALFAGNLGDDFVALGRVQLGNVPPGLSASAFVVDPNQFPQVLTVSLTGNAPRHNSSSNTNLPTVFQDSAFRGVNAADVANATTNLQVQFLNPVLTYYTKAFYESWKNDGSITNPVNVVIFGDALNAAIGADLYASGKVTAQNVPAGLTPAVTLLSATGVVVSLSGNASPHTSAASTASLGFTFADSAFQLGEAVLVTNYNASDLSVNFLSQSSSNWYVNASTGVESNDGTTPQTAVRSITNALARAQTNANDVINIAAGTYTVPPGGISVSKTVTFLGESPVSTIIQAHDLPLMATNTPLFKAAAGRNAIFRSLTLRNGRAPSGAVFSQGGNRIELSFYNCAFLNNAATNGGGGAIYASSQPSFDYFTLSDCVFTNNTATGGGGAINVFRLANPGLVSNCVFFANSSSTNGGAFLYEYQALGPVMINTLFLNNKAAGSGGAFYAGGTGSTLDMNRCAVINNTAGVNGGGTFSSGNTTMTNCTFSGNSCGSAGGAFYMASGTPFLYNSTFFLNSALTAGGLSSYGAPLFWSCIVAGNSASSTIAPDVRCTYAQGVVWATNSIIGITNGAFTAASVTLTSAGPNTPNVYSNYCGTAAAPQNPKLLPPAANGGTAVGATGFKWPIYTCALQSDSVAVDHGLNPLALTTDARGVGYARTVGAAADMGAYEYGAQPPVFGTIFMLR
jgi:predicted outer membrane repeat protein